MINDYFYEQYFPGSTPLQKRYTELSTCVFTEDLPVLQNLSHYCSNLKVLRLRGLFASTEPPKLPKDTLVTIGLLLPQFNVVFDSLHEYPVLSELELK